MEGVSALPSVWPVHGGYFTGHMCPFEFTLRRSVQCLLELQQLEHEAEVRLDDDVQSTGPNVTTKTEVSAQGEENSRNSHLLRPRKRKFERLHDFGDADCG